MKKIKLLIPVVVGAAALCATAAQAASGYTINVFHLYSGPGHNFARLDTVPNNARVHIFGCTPSFEWCDVSWGEARGWIDANGLEIFHGGRRTVVANAGPDSAIPVITYGAYERERPQWRDRDDDGVPNRVDEFPDDPYRR